MRRRKKKKKGKNNSQEPRQARVRTRHKTAPNTPTTPPSLRFLKERKKDCPPSEICNLPNAEICRCNEMKCLKKSTAHMPARNVKDTLSSCVQRQEQIPLLKTDHSGQCIVQYIVSYSRCCRYRVVPCAPNYLSNRGPFSSSDWRC